MTDSDLSIADKAAVLAILHQVSVTHCSSVQRKGHQLTVTFVTCARRIDRQKTFDRAGDVDPSLLLGIPPRD